MNEKNAISSIQRLCVFYIFLIVWACQIKIHSCVPELILVTYLSKYFGIWPKKILNSMHGKKCHFGNFTRNRPIGWIGLPS